MPCPLPPTPCLGSDAPRLGKARSWPAHQGQFHLGSSQELGQGPPRSLASAAACPLPGEGGQHSWAARSACRGGAQPCRSPETRHVLSHAACAMLGSLLHALLQTPWDPGPSQTLCCHVFLLRVKRTDGTGRKGRVCPPGDSRVGLISGRPSPTEGEPPCSPPPWESQGAQLCLPRTQWEDGVWKHTLVTPTPSPAACPGF